MRRRKRCALGRMPARASARQEGFSACGLNRGAAIRALEIVAIAILSHHPMHNLLPMTQVLLLLLLKAKSSDRVRAALLPPAQPLRAERIHKEIE